MDVVPWSHAPKAHRDEQGRLVGGRMYRLEIDGPLGPRLIVGPGLDVRDDWDVVAENLRSLGYVLDCFSADRAEKIEEEWVYPLGLVVSPNRCIRAAGYQWSGPSADYADGCWYKSGIVLIPEADPWNPWAPRYLVARDRRSLPEGADDAIDGVTCSGGEDVWRQVEDAIWTAARAAGALTVARRRA